jgi:hypothetical protein
VLSRRVSHVTTSLSQCANRSSVAPGVASAIRSWFARRPRSPSPFAWSGCARACRGMSGHYSRFAGSRTRRRAHDSERRGLAAVVTQRHSRREPAGRVVSQRAAAGRRVVRGGSVEITVSDGLPPVTVPDVVSGSSAGAEARLAQLGLSVGAHEVVSHGRPAPSCAAARMRGRTSPPGRISSSPSHAPRRGAASAATRLTATGRRPRLGSPLGIGA